MKKENNEYILSTKKIIYANKGLISLNKGRGEWELFEGYDAPLYITDTKNSGEREPNYTIQELIEIAIYQRNLWNEFITDIKDGLVPHLE